MTNRGFTDMRALRREVASLLAARRYRHTRHAILDHPELSPHAQLALLRKAGGHRPDLRRGVDGVYVCWARHPRLGNCRIVFAIDEASDGDRLVIITAFPEEPRP